MVNAILAGTLTLELTCAAPATAVPLTLSRAQSGHAWLRLPCRPIFCVPPPIRFMPRLSLARVHRPSAGYQPPPARAARRGGEGPRARARGVGGGIAGGPRRRSCEARMAVETGHLQLCLCLATPVEQLCPPSDSRELATTIRRACATRLPAAGACAADGPTLVRMQTAWQGPRRLARAEAGGRQAGGRREGRDGHVRRGPTPVCTQRPRRSAPEGDAAPCGSASGGPEAELASALAASARGRCARRGARRAAPAGGARRRCRCGDGPCHRHMPTAACPPLLGPSASNWRAAAAAAVARGAREPCGAHPASPRLIATPRAGCGASGHRVSPRA